MPDTNAIGDRGENLCSTRLTQEYLFNCYLLGGKTPTFDLLLEINDANKPYKALVQVKSTDKKDSLQKNGNIKVQILKKKLEELLKDPMPTYVAGVSIYHQVMHLAPAFDVNASFPSIPPCQVFTLNDTPQNLAILKLLKDDIIRFWESFNMHNNKTTYKSLL